MTNFYSYYFVSVFMVKNMWGASFSNWLQLQIGLECFQTSFFHCRWLNFRISAPMFIGFSSYLPSDWVKRQWRESRYKLTMTHFQNFFFCCCIIWRVTTSRICFLELHTALDDPWVIVQASLTFCSIPLDYTDYYIIL